MITEKTIKYTKNNKVMAFLTLEDLVGTVEVIVFPNSYEKYSSLLNEDEGTSVCGIALNLSEEDLLRLSSARVDENLFEGTYLYAVIYQADFENAAVTTYPVNPQVFTLMQWDPNIVSLFTVKKEQEKRSVLENHLQLFTQKEMGNSIEAELESLPDSQEELPEQDNNISQM